MTWHPTCQPTDVGPLWAVDSFVVGRSSPSRRWSNFFVLMGSLIKKRRKRMRKKKHKKMLKRTRFQRRAKKK